MKLLMNNGERLWAFFFILYAFLAFFFPQYFLRLRIYVVFLFFMAIWLLSFKKI